jgi:S1-C subfamily serine protease
MFTGNHLDYHTASDDADKINAAGGARVAMIVADVATAVANRSAALTYVKAPPEVMGGGDVRARGASLGTVPSYSEDPNQPPGVLLSDVVPDGPAQKAGLKGGDRIVKLGDIDIRNVNDLMFVLVAAKPGADIKVTFVRDGKPQTITATYGKPRGKK